VQDGTLLNMARGMVFSRRRVASIFKAAIGENARHNIFVVNYAATYSRQEKHFGVLRFLKNPLVTFTNNWGPDIRMTEVQQKISGCFRSFKGTLIFCRIQSYLSTCDQQGISETEVLEFQFSAKMPDFIVKPAMGAE